jgi:3-isopropylmalate/(R)-2-methylmalate dehydratase small subunit
MILEGSARIFGDNIHGDVACNLNPETKLKLDPQLLASNCMIGYDPNFSQRAKPGDLIIAGENFGTGHMHPEFYLSFKIFGIAAVIAESVSRRFLREAVNDGLPVLECEGIRKIIDEGDRVRVDLSSGKIENLTNGKQISASPMPSELIELIKGGGIIPYLKSQKGKKLFYEEKTRKS